MCRILLLSTLFISSIISAQVNRCYTDKYIEYRNSLNPSFKNDIDSTYNFMLSNLNDNPQRDFETIRIPVVVHVLYKTENQNLTDSLVRAQIDILNQDYARLNPDTNLTREIFKPVASATGIEFYLAQFDPTGLPTNGIIKKQTDVTSFFSLTNLDVMKSEANGGADAWPTDQYLNIWVCNLSIPILNVPVILGFATPPNSAPNWPAGSGASESQYDGVVIHYEVFGSIPNATGTFESVNKGRTLVHEVGHYLGLRHTWGDPGQGEDGCVVDDGINDTPISAAANQQTCDYAMNSCNEGVDDLPDMIENYMDYSNENCLNMFSKQQVEAMRFVVENFRSDLLLSTPIISTLSPKINVYPNPANDILTLKHGLSNLTGDITIFDFCGKIVKSMKVNNNNSKIDLVVNELAPGSYFIQLNSQSGAYFNRFTKF
jgi:hypothetical protein